MAPASRQRYRTCSWWATLHPLSPLKVLRAPPGSSRITLRSEEFSRQSLIVWCIRAVDNMYITIDERDSRPLYQQVVDEIKGLIAGGELPEGTTLPPVRQVAADLGVNLNTIA